jgi:ABC-type branched-subunit amino acid transport system permease subunit
VSARALNVLGLALVAVIGIAVLILTPRLFDLDVVLNITVYMIMAVLALSLALVWGFGGILCFGQSAFFGLGAYTYAIAMINIGESTAPLILAVFVPAAFAALLGYFMFYGRISDVYLGVITLTVTLILFNSINSTAGPEFHIGSAKLGGFNGIPGIPSLNVPFFKDWQIDLEGMFYLSTASLLLTYFGLRTLLASRFGRTIVGIRENEHRAQLLGYDPRAYKLATFVIGAARGLCGLPVRQLGLLCQSNHLWPGAVGPDYYLGYRRWARHVDWADSRMRWDSMAHCRFGRERAERRCRLASPARQRSAHPRRHPDRLRPARAERPCANDRRP